MKGIIFTETQHFEFWDIFVVLMILIAGFYVFTKRRHRKGRPVNTALYKVILYTLLCLPVPFLMLNLCRLETRIDEEGIKVKFFPFDNEGKSYSWDHIRNLDVGTYDPVLDYGGWGLRNGAYNTSGDKALFIRFTNGKHFLIGTQKPSELKRALLKTGKLK
ncbi:hypothetical protein R1T16_05835 [Flavobacterium sp. DG1-102-2]|uniref:hypothetical protein n=1 Tax=Flavobacterium sp. DG1-102-2 TaxID=3081663 RepID=UPI00294A6DF8|nr:hypothetical protein [Flavobacterium sp. DG1-102-2]MDV6167936.1 hypothetical protein [Flavobacterium sp. DG1-102-2]